jgi:hypothetical protein
MYGMTDTPSSSTSGPVTRPVPARLPSLLGRGIAQRALRPFGSRRLRRLVLICGLVLLVEHLD